MSERKEAQQPDSSPPAEGRAATHQDCPFCSFLEVCEVAFREVANAQLSLSEKEFDLPRVKQHLFTEKCRVCLRCYRNAKRAYARLQLGRGVPAPRVLVSADVVVPDAIERPAIRTPAATDPGEVHYRVEPAVKGSGLNALVAELACNRTSSSDWEITLVHHPREVDPAGNDADKLRPFDNYLLTLQVNLDQRDPLILQLRLGVDDKGSLISSTLSLGDIDPVTIKSILLVSWKQRPEIVP